MPFAFGFLINPTAQPGSSLPSPSSFPFPPTNIQPRLLRQRSGHYEPPKRIRFYKHVEQIVSAGNDQTLRVFHIFRERKNREISQGKIESRARKLNLKVEQLKLPVINQFAISYTRERDWDNIITSHRDHPFAYSWNWQDKKLGKLRFASTQSNKTNIHAVAISSCGNYCFTANSSGFIDKFNIQSGMHRASTKTSFNSNSYQPISSLLTDSLNLHVISAGLDGLSFPPFPSFSSFFLSLSLFPSYISPSFLLPSLPFLGMVIV